VCTGDKKIDAILEKSDLGCKLGLTKKNNTYTMDGFCESLRNLNGLNKA